MKKTLYLIMFLLSPLTFASEKEASGTVQVYAFGESGVVIIRLSNSNTSCGNRYWFKPDTDYNKALLSMVLSAQMAGKRVWVNGTGECLTSYPYGKAYKLTNMTIYN